MFHLAKRQRLLYKYNYCVSKSRDRVSRLRKIAEMSCNNLILFLLHVLPLKTTAFDIMITKYVCTLLYFVLGSTTDIGLLLNLLASLRYSINIHPNKKQRPYPNLRPHFPHGCGQLGHEPDNLRLEEPQLSRHILVPVALQIAQQPVLSQHLHNQPHPQQ